MLLGELRLTGRDLDRNRCTSFVQMLYGSETTKQGHPQKEKHPSAPAKGQRETPPNPNPVSYACNGNQLSGKAGFLITSPNSATHLMQQPQEGKHRDGQRSQFVFTCASSMTFGHKNPGNRMLWMGRDVSNASTCRIMWLDICALAHVEACGLVVIAF